MGVEIERKFLVDIGRLGPLPEGERIAQGYVADTERVWVRVRVAGERGFLTLKGPTEGIIRAEFEYEIPRADAERMMAGFCQGGTIEKVRYRIAHAGHTWDLDIFEGDNRGLVIAEVELQSEDEAVSLPEWVTEEVTGVTRYYNVNLLRDPYCRWG